MCWRATSPRRRGRRACTRRRRPRWWPGESGLHRRVRRGAIPCCRRPGPPPRLSGQWRCGIGDGQLGELAVGRGQHQGLDRRRSPTRASSSRLRTPHQAPGMWPLSRYLRLVPRSSTATMSALVDEPASQLGDLDGRGPSDRASSPAARSRACRPPRAAPVEHHGVVPAHLPEPRRGHRGPHPVVVDQHEAGVAGRRRTRRWPGRAGRRGRCTLPGRWPASYSSGVRTSSRYGRAVGVGLPGGELVVVDRCRTPKRSPDRCGRRPRPRPVRPATGRERARRARGRRRTRPAPSPWCRSRGRRPGSRARR